MKNLILGLALIVGLMFAGASAAAVPPVECYETYINGVVYSGADLSTPPVPNVQVDVTCNGYTHSSMTADPSGYYGLIFSDAENCNVGEPVQACVGSVCNTKAVLTCLEANQLNVLAVDIFNVPEFGLVAASVALAGAVAGFVFLRKKN